MIRRERSRAMPIEAIASTRMKLATYNVNGINGRLPVLLRWLE